MPRKSLDPDNESKSSDFLENVTDYIPDSQNLPNLNDHKANMIYLASLPYATSLNSPASHVG
jgi:hypothetical protein